MGYPFPFEHRPYPVDARPWIMHQVWHDLLFAHWPVPVATLRRIVPPALDLDLFDGQAWLGVVPFRMSGIRPRYLPALPGLSAFPELNVRTYVALHDRPGVFFLSLDATNPLAIKLARWLYHLPYRRAAMSLRYNSGRVYYECQRRDVAAQFRGWYEPSGDIYHARPGTLEAWLTERYCMYPVDDRGRVYRGEVHHAPWPLQPARAAIDLNTMTRPLGIDLPAQPPLLHFSKRLDVVIWPLQRLY